jgi:hypothetical protein
MEFSQVMGIDSCVHIYQWIVKIQRRETCQEKLNKEAIIVEKSLHARLIFFTNINEGSMPLKNMLNFFFNKRHLYAPTYSLLGKGCKRKRKEWASQMLI